MNRKILLSIITIGTVIGFSGCGSSEVSCSGETEIGLVEEIVLPTIKDKFIMETMNEKNPSAGMQYMLAKGFENMAEQYGTKPNKKPEDIEGYKEANTEMEKEFKSYKFSLHDIRTTKKNSELNQVECSGKITVTLPTYHMDYDVTYNAQLGDDKENVYVEVQSME